MYKMTMLFVTCINNLIWEFLLMLHQIADKIEEYHQ
jgi:hypothetical protein